MVNLKALTKRRTPRATEIAPLVVGGEQMRTIPCREGVSHHSVPEIIDNQFVDVLPVRSRGSLDHNPGGAQLGHVSVVAFLLMDLICRGWSNQELEQKATSPCGHWPKHGAHQTRSPLTAENTLDA
jgi:hypothetical protein